MARPVIQSAKGTRDCYPEDTLKRRYIEKAWRSTAIRHGFDEIEGPTFEPSELYAVKSGEGILGELFQAFSGKSEDEIAQVRETGRAPFALRPEFTPTLARMYAARARQLTQPCKWFTAGPYFRAERPQRGRLREFLQWNVDVIGMPDDRSQFPTSSVDAEVLDASIASLEAFGLTDSSVKVKINDRDFICRVLAMRGVSEERMNDALALLDRTGKMPVEQMRAHAQEIGFSLDAFLERTAAILKMNALAEVKLQSADGTTYRGEADELLGVLRAVLRMGRRSWCDWDPSIVRGLAYYTGTVFEVIADGERAVAGGGRYDKLIELMGGPPTPAVGFAMGDVVLGLLLEDHGLMPEGAELMDAVGGREASRRPEVFVINAGSDSSDGGDAGEIEPLVRRLTADLRRGVESEAYREREGRKPWHADRYADRYAAGEHAEAGGVRPLHARLSYKSTRNLKKLLGDAEKQHSRFAAIVHGADRVQLKDFDRRVDLTPRDVPGLPSDVAEFSVDPGSAVYVGRAVRRLLG